MIKSLSVKNLNGRMSFDLNFNDDINIITGKNGSGKTTVLKLIWYAISGNLERIVQEIKFDSFTVVTDKITISMLKEDRKGRRFLKLSYQPTDGELKEIEKPIERTKRGEELEDANRQVSKLTGSSVFFPTFRRIEGGFSVRGRSDDESVHYVEGNRVVMRSGSVYYSQSSNLTQAMTELSEHISVGQHRFVASISTDDLNRLLTSKYADITERSNSLLMEMSTFILSNVSNSEGSPEVGIPPERSQQLLSEILERAENVTKRSDHEKQPFTVLSKLIERIFQYKGIKVSGPVTLGQTKEAIASELLSAGEKQMLSFLCYNAFADKTCLFIDEPEISLHVDWQRVLFPVLLEQSTGNQFIVATHSPFIYSRYADKELILGERGDENANTKVD
ncbi:MAG: AAA family ATPase [Gemmatales bacterium]